MTHAHRTVVILPTEFTAHRMQRMFLTRRHATRMPLPAVVVARRAPRPAPAPVADYTRPDGRSWSSLASVLLMIVVVVAAVLVTGVRI